MGLCLYNYNGSVQSIITDMREHFGNTRMFDFRPELLASCLCALHKMLLLCAVL